MQILATRATQSAGKVLRNGVGNMKTANSCNTLAQFLRDLIFMIFAILCLIRKEEIVQNKRLAKIIYRKNLLPSCVQSTL